MMEINKTAAECHAIAREKGWYDPGATKSLVEAHMLIVTEIAEATEEVRSGNPPIYQIRETSSFAQYESCKEKVIPNDPRAGKTGKYGSDPFAWDPKVKPEGEAIELVDAFIRIMDVFAANEWDLEWAVKAKMDYNRSRPYRHGGKRY